MTKAPHKLRCCVCVTQHKNTTSLLHDNSEIFYFSFLLGNHFHNLLYDKIILSSYNNFRFRKSSNSCRVTCQHDTLLTEQPLTKTTTQTQWISTGRGGNSPICITTQLNIEAGQFRAQAVKRRDFLKLC